MTNEIKICTQNGNKCAKKSACKNNEAANVNE